MYFALPSPFSASHPLFRTSLVFISAGSLNKGAPFKRGVNFEVFTNSHSWRSSCIPRNAQLHNLASCGRVVDSHILRIVRPACVSPRISFVTASVRSARDRYSNRITSFQSISHGTLYGYFSLVVTTPIFSGLRAA